MRNPFLSRLGRLDQAYPLAIKLPKSVKKTIAKTVPSYLNGKLNKGYMLDRMTVIVTDVCNLACSHCFISTSEREKKAWEMGIEEYEKFFASTNGLISQAHFTGGEPTVRKDFPEIVILASKLGGIKNSSIFTNGLLGVRIMKQIQAILDGCNMKIGFQISIDGEEQMHDEIRGQQGALRRTLATMEQLKALKKENPNRIDRLNINTVISKQNLHKLRKIIESVRDNGFSHSFCFARDSRIHAFNLPENESITEYNPVEYDSYLSPEEMEEALDILHKELWDRDPNNLTHATNRVTLETNAKNFKRGYSTVKCYSGYTNMILFPNGDIAECEFLQKFSNLRNHNWSLHELLNSDIYMNHMARNRKCWCTHECSVGLSISYHPHLAEDLLLGADGGKYVIKEPTEASHPITNIK